MTRSETRHKGLWKSPQQLDEFLDGSGYFDVNDLGKYIKDLFK